MSANVQSLALHNYEEKPSWHGLEVDFGEPIYDNETLNEVGGRFGYYDIVVENTPTFIKRDGKYIPTGTTQLVQTNVPTLGTVIVPRMTSNYVPLQPGRLLDILDPLSRTIQVESVGVFGEYGEIFMVEFQLPPYFVGGLDKEEHCAYLLVGNNHRNGGIWYSGVHTRVVCQNTWHQAIKGIPPIPHSNDASDFLQFVTQVYHKSINAQQHEFDLMERLFKTKVTPETTTKFINTVYPPVKKSNKLTIVEAHPDIPSGNLGDQLVAEYFAQVSHTQNNRDRLRYHIEDFNDTYPYAGDTAYALFNGLTDALLTAPRTPAVRALNNLLLVKNSPQAVALENGKDYLVNLVK